MSKISGEKKFSDLAGIVHDQPDVFETPDLPEIDPNALHSRDDTDVVEKLDISARDARKRFTSSELDTGMADFSGNLRGYRAKRGAEESANEFVWEGVPARTNETPFAKFQRIQREIRDLTEQLNDATQLEPNQADADEPKLSREQLAALIDSLRAQINTFHIDALLGCDSNDVATSAARLEALGASRSAGSFSTLMARLDQLANSTSAPKKPESATKKHDGNETGAGTLAVDSEAVVYRLTRRAANDEAVANRFANEARVYDLEARLNRLESLVGSAEKQKSAPAKSTLPLSAVAASQSDASSLPVVDAIQQLGSKLALLGDTNLDAIDGRMSILLQKLQAIADRRETIAELTNQGKVNELYDAVSRWSSTVDALPSVVDRLVALRSLHESAAAFRQNLAAIDAEQQTIDSLLRQHSDLLTKVDTNMRENAETIKKNLETIDQRVRSVQSQNA